MLCGAIECNFEFDALEPLSEDESKNIFSILMPTFYIYDATNADYKEVECYNDTAVNINQRVDIFESPCDSKNFTAIPTRIKNISGQTRNVVNSPTFRQEINYNKCE